MILNRVMVIKNETNKEVVTERRDKSGRFLKKLTEKRLSINKMTIEIVGNINKEELLASWESPQGRE